jgi:hypothetical protein
MIYYLPLLITLFRLTRRLRSPELYIYMKVYIYIVKMRSNNNNKVLKYILNTFVVFDRIRIYILLNMAKMTRTKIDILFYFVKTIIERTNGREKKEY